MIEIWVKNSSTSVFPNLKKFYYDTNTINLSSAKNMTVCAQVCLRTTLEDFTAKEVTFSNLPKGVTARYNYQGYYTFNDGIPYPDIMLSDKTVNVVKHRTQGLYVFFDVSNDAPCSKSTITVTVNTSRDPVQFIVTLKIYDVVLPEPCDSQFGHEYFFNPIRTFPFNGNPPESKPIPDYYDYELYSDDWWHYIGELAKASKALHINVLWIPGIPLLQTAGSKRISQEKWHFDFKYLEKYVDTFLANGSYNRIIFQDIIVPVHGKAIKGLDENGKLVRFDIPGEDAELWAKNFYTALYDFFKRKRLLNYLMMHLQDEPHSTEYWIWGQERCAKYMPGVKCSEPLDFSVAKELIGHCHHFIPRIDVYENHKKLFQQIQRGGDVVWCYSCCEPQAPHYLNKMIDLPQIYSRLIIWACFSQNLTGFLHWGGNFWEGVNSFGIFPTARDKGDGYIVYPDVPNNSVRMSNRGVQTIEGIQDWELLNMYSKIDPKGAISIAKEAAKSFVKFNNDPVLLDNLREKLLTLLEENN